ncbi:hypothetical protein ACA910_009901 [Epithemia clementina (nom. ined.)]
MDDDRAMDAVAASDEEELFPLAPACTGLALDRINDMIDFEIDHILYDKSSRLDHYESLSYFWSLHPARNIEAGRRYIRQLVAKLLVLCCGRTTQVLADPDHYDEDEEAELSKRFPRLYTFDRRKWKDIENQLAKLRCLIQRKDAMLNYLGTETDVEDNINDPKNAHDPDTLRNKKKVQIVTRMIQIHRALAPIRKTIHDNLSAKNFDFSNTFSQDTLKEILSYSETLEDVDAQKLVKLLFKVQKVPSNTAAASEGAETEITKSDGGGETRTEYALIEGKQLAEALRTGQYDLENFQKKVENLLQEMNSHVYSNYLSILAQLRYTIETGSAMDKVLRATLKSRRDIAGKLSIDDLRRQRTTLKNSHGADPLVESLQVSQNYVATGGGGSAGGGKKPRAKAKATGKRPDAPAKGELVVEANASPSPAKRPRELTYPRGNPDPGLFDERGNVTKRMAWSDEEKYFIKLGVKQFGLGNWMAIKEEYSDILRNRTNVQIKDCWRTMVRKGELSEPDSRFAVERAAERAAVAAALGSSTGSSPEQQQKKPPPTAAPPLAVVANDGEGEDMEDNY